MVVVLNLLNQLVTVFLTLHDRQKVGKAHDSIQRCTDLMTHIGKEGSLQTVALLCFVTGINQIGLHLLLFVDAKRCSYNRRRVTILIARRYRGVTLLPIHGVIQLHTIGLMIGVAAPGENILKRNFHTLHVG